MGAREKVALSGQTGVPVDDGARSPFLLANRVGERGPERADEPVNNGTMISLTSDNDIEKTLLATIAVGGSVEALEKLDKLCFGDEGNQKFFEELRMMHEAGHPLGDPQALARWFTSEAVKRRWGDVNVVYEAAELGEFFVTTAHLEYYLREVYRDWLRRSLQLLCVRTIEQIEQHDDPLAALRFLTHHTDRLYEKVADRFPETLEGTA